MYDELVMALHNGAEFLECSTPGIKNSFAKMCHNAADAIEELAKDLERSKEYETFWNKEAEEALRRFQVAVANKPRWIPVTERLPKKNEWVLVRSKFVKIRTDFISNDGHWHTTPAVTHWMPLPEPPKEET